MNDPTFIKRNICNIKDYHIEEKVEVIIFKLINFDNKIFFAEEISTKSIFPIFNGIETSTETEMVFFSYLKKASYAVFYPLIGDKPFEFKLNKQDEDFDSLEFPDEDEVKKYLEEKQNNPDWKASILSMESCNEYMCDINLIKQKISELQKNGELLYEKLDESVKYKSPIDLKSIDSFGYDLSTQSNLCNLIGREKEIKRIIKTTCIRENSVLLVGDAGCGKTAIIEMMAKNIRENKNPWLNGKVIFYLSLSSVTCDTEYSGKLEEHFEKIIECCKINKGKIILFIDEIHNLYGLGKTEDSATDGMNILKPYISNGTITIIGATTKEEYEKYMTIDKAFLRRFEKIEISLPDEKMNIKILLAYINELEEKYKIKLDLDDTLKNEIVKYIIEATNIKHQRKFGDVNITNPTISKYIMEDAFAEALYNKNNLVSLNDVIYAITFCNKISSTIKEKITKDLNLRYKDDSYLSEKNNIIQIGSAKKL